VAFSPDSKVMYVSMWGEATYQIMREDGLAFSAATGTIAYEKASATAGSTPAGSTPAGSTPAGSTPASGGSSPATAPAKSAAGTPETMWAAVFLAMMAIN
jgi:hypothetical protein